MLRLAIKQGRRAELVLGSLVEQVRGSSQQNCMESLLSELFLAEFPEAGFGTGLEEPELRLRQRHLRADLILALLV